MIRSVLLRTRDGPFIFQFPTVVTFLWKIRDLFESKKISIEDYDVYRSSIYNDVDRVIMANQIVYEVTIPVEVV